MGADLEGPENHLRESAKSAVKKSSDGIANERIVVYRLMHGAIYNNRALPKEDRKAAVSPLAPFVFFLTFCENFPFSGERLTRLKT